MSEYNSINGKSLLLLESLIDYYKVNMHIFTCILINKNSISLRILDWLVTNYSKKHNVIYSINNTHFNVYLDYKNQLKAYSKKLFDPFCRRERILFFDHDGKEIITTVGQLNFFRWALENKILDYILEHFDDIENDMNNSLRNLYKKKNSDDKTRRKRTELSISATKSVNKHDVSIIVQFD